MGLIKRPAKARKYEDILEHAYIKAARVFFAADDQTGLEL